LPTDLICRCQEKAWFDQAIMLEWVEKILALYVENVLHGIVPILFLDDFSVHKTGAVVRIWAWRSSSSLLVALEWCSQLTWDSTSP